MEPKHKVALIIDGVISFHHTIKEATIEAASPKYQSSKVANIYIHQMSAQRGGWEWGDKPIKEKPKEKKLPTTEFGVERKSNRWTDIELDVLKQARKDEMSIKDIAATLHRTPKAVGIKVSRLDV